MTSHNDAGRRRIGRIVGRTAAGGACDVRELRVHCCDAIDGGANLLEVDLTVVDRIETALIAFLVELLRMSRQQHVLLKLKPSIALDRWLRDCSLDNELRPIRAGAA